MLIEMHLAHLTEHVAILFFDFIGRAAECGCSHGISAGVDHIGNYWVRICIFRGACEADEDAFVDLKSAAVIVKIEFCFGSRNTNVIACCVAAFVV